MTTKAQTAPKRRPSGTIKTLATGLTLSRRRVHTLLALGMPESLADAKKWMKAKHTTGGENSPEALRAERILLVRAQRERTEMENKVRAGQLIESGAAQESITRTMAGARLALVKALIHDCPPRLEGLPANKIAREMKSIVMDILRELSTAEFYDSPEVRAIVEAAKREARN